MKVKSIVVNPFQVNCYIYYDENSHEGIIVDPAVFEESEEAEIKTYLESKDINIKYVLITHGHIDHIMGNKWIKEITNAPIYMHKADEKLLKSVRVQGAMYGLAVPILPDIDKFISEAELIEFNGCKLKVLHTPGHSSGSVCFTDEENRIMFTGDCIFNKSIGRTDLIDGNTESLMDSIFNKIFKYGDDFILYPGHMESTTIGDERQNNPFLQK